VIERSEYEPYGKLLNRPLTDGPGFTGHVQDAATSMTYMQQRYHDPGIGRFLSVDPVTAYDGDARHFNRYIYAYNNPYKFTDPDGRCPQCLWGAPIGAGVNLGAQLLTNKGSFKERWEKVSWKQVGVATVAGGLSGGVSAVASTATTTLGAVAANVAGNAAVGALATQASAQVEGKTASVKEVIQGAALSGGAAGLGSAIEEVPGVLARTASSGMSQTERAATANLLGGVKEATPGFKYSNPSQTAANATGAAVSASPDLKPVLDRKK
jgi:RHS repeat-associated protein